MANDVDTKSSTANASLRATFQLLGKHSTSTRRNAIGLKLWRDDIAEMMAKLVRRKQSKGDWLSNVKSKLSHYEAEYQQQKEATTILELAFWKVKLDELGKGENTMSNKKRKIDGSDFRSQCRISCGADIVIQHVLSYLVVPPPKDCHFDLDVPPLEDYHSDEEDNDSSSEETGDNIDSESDDSSSEESSEGMNSDSDDGSSGESDDMDNESIV